MIARKTGLAYPIVTTAESRKLTEMSQRMMSNGSEASTVSMSVLKTLRTRPGGFVSKNDRGARKRRKRTVVWRFREALRNPNANSR